MRQLLDEQRAQLSQRQKDYFSSIAIPLKKIVLRWEYGVNEAFDAWAFADFRERNVGAAYCEGGFGAMGAPWGLIFFDRDNFGMDSGWYRSLGSLLDDGWVDGDT